MSPPLEASFTRARAYVKTPHFRRLWRYAAVSVISTTVSLTGLFVFFRVLKIGPAWEANIIATAIATVPSYYLNRTWAWGKTGPSHVMKELVPFWVISFLSLVLSTGAVSLASSEAHHLSLSHNGETLVVEAANFITYGFLWVGKFLFFNKVLFKIDHKLHEAAELVLASDEMAAP